MTTDGGAPRATPVTLADVARAAGVSIATASKALNGRTQVRESTRLRVEEAAASLSFTPNWFARGLTSSRTGSVGVITSELDHRFVVPILRGAGQALDTASLLLLVADTRDDALREQMHLRSLLTRRVDGLLIVGRTTNPRPPAPVMSGVPVVYVYAPSTGEQDVSFTPDNVMAGRLAAEHLIAQGRTRIALVNGESSYAAARDRAEGVLAALAAHGLEPVGGASLYGQWGEAWGRDCARLLVRGGDPVDGIIGGSDHIARGVLDTLRDEGRDVPGDVAVIGFDDWDLLVREARPPLSSVAMELEHLGRVAAQRLVDMIDGATIAGVSREPVRVVARASTGA
ncbi:LacI family DNA-binding transcriptional regulator [Clavibacter sp. km1a]|uniref:LacI family DNA-binding transcriptional regulator n=1 Tax=Clavibacter sp. km1a TaxID=3459136 RepID=UPI004041EB2C